MKSKDTPSRTWVKFPNGKIAYHDGCLRFKTKNHFAAPSIYFDGIFESEVEIVPDIQQRINEHDIISVISVKDSGGEQKIVLKNQYGFTFEITALNYGMFVFPFIFKTIDKRSPLGGAVFRYDGGKFLDLIKGKSLSFRWQDGGVIMQAISCCPHKGTNSVTLKSK